MNCQRTRTGKGVKGQEQGRVSKDKDRNRCQRTQRALTVPGVPQGRPQRTSPASCPPAPVSPAPVAAGLEPPPPLAAVTPSV